MERKLSLLPRLRGRRRGRGNCRGLPRSSTALVFETMLRNPNVLEPQGTQRTLWLTSLFHRKEVETERAEETRQVGGLVRGEPQGSSFPRAPPAAGPRGHPKMPPAHLWFRAEGVANGNAK